jgi:DNA helicase HerA-like ATPase
MTLTLHDKSIEDTLERINKQLKRIDEFESLGMYECAAYFLSDDQYAAEVAASTYKGLMRGESSGIEIAAINSWGGDQKEKTELISQYVKNFIHPVFSYNGPTGNIEVTPCSLVSGNELAIHMGLPRRSVCGLPVIEHADFGKEIVTYDGTQRSQGINLGKIFNMGSTGNSKVSLDKDSLAMHTFVTGSTGSGKSNTVYEMIRQLGTLGVNYLVIEPAKGEYKNVFGSKSDVQVYGTNPQYTNLLRINPFKFPKGIHILEHIDRLIEIFNVCWPMYAAMPAVLKEAVLQAYESCGWDLAESRNQYSDNLFPTFSDLLNKLASVIQSSAYSEEVKSNYTGSLVTRIKSLTNGLNGQIFAANELDNNALFDKKAIVDISRVGSTETKSLIMGILIMRLSEHRMSSSQGMNTPLHHITVLEEAHNILKRTSTEQSLEGANVVGKSVEMISNAIAEMRTYGEGFIIADQSPSAVDMSAIRNTNTKIIMRLPDEQDRRLAGKAAGLKDNQLDEISKLPKGVAVVYQNDWLEPVLCKVEKSPIKECPYKKTSNISFVSAGEQKRTLIQNLLNKSTGENLDTTIGELTDMLVGMNIPTEIKVKALKALRINGTCSLSDISPIIYGLVCDSLTEKESENVDSIEEWKNVFVYAQDSLLAGLDSSSQNKAIECILREQIERYSRPAKYLEAWNEFLKGEVI